jgi:flagellar motility protein MotE (MotC chaperone)
LREVRLLPLVIVAIASLLALKTVSLFTSGGYLLGGLNAPEAEATHHSSVKTVPASVQEAFRRLDITGATPAPKPPPPDAGASGKAGATSVNPAAKSGDAKPGAPPGASQTPPARAPVEGRAITLEGRALSPAERAILERLQERRQELDDRGRELDLRENLVAGAEKRLEGRMAELKELEARLQAEMNKRSEAEAARFKSLISMYENMKAKEAARIFDRLDMKILLDVASQINPRRMSDILAQMSPEAAERLTVELAGRARAVDKTPPPQELPKIEGRPG